jgi:hypothetical protein
MCFLLVSNDAQRRTGRRSKCESEHELQGQREVNREEGLVACSSFFPKTSVTTVRSIQWSTGSTSVSKLLADVTDFDQDKNSFSDTDGRATMTRGPKSDANEILFLQALLSLVLSTLPTISLNSREVDGLTVCGFRPLNSTSSFIQSWKTTTLHRILANCLLNRYHHD